MRRECNLILNASSLIEFKYLQIFPKVLIFIRHFFIRIVPFVVQNRLDLCTGIGLLSISHAVNEAGNKIMEVLFACSDVTLLSHQQVEYRHIFA